MYVFVKCWIIILQTILNFPLSSEHSHCSIHLTAEYSESAVFSFFWIFLPQLHLGTCTRLSEAKVPTIPMCAFAICPISPICVFLIPTTVCISTQLQALPSSYPCISIGYYPTKSSTLSSHHLSTECFPSLSFSWPYFLPPAVDLSTCSPTAQSWLQKLEAQLPTCYIILPADAHLHTGTLHIGTLVHCTTHS